MKCLEKTCFNCVKALMCDEWKKPSHTACILTLYGHDGMAVDKRQYKSIYEAVIAGYVSGKEFLVHELPDQDLISYWIGRQADKNKPEYKNLHYLIAQKEYINDLL